MIEYRKGRECNKQSVPHIVENTTCVVVVLTLAQIDVFSVNSKQLCPTPWVKQLADPFPFTVIISWNPVHE